MFIVPNHKKNGDYHESPSLAYLIMNFDSKENDGNKSFSCKAKVLKPCILMKRTCFSAESWKELRLSWEPKFVPFDGRTLILRKMGELIAFLAKPKHQYNVS